MVDDGWRANERAAAPPAPAAAFAAYMVDDDGRANEQAAGVGGIEPNKGPLAALTALICRGGSRGGAGGGTFLRFGSLERGLTTTDGDRGPLYLPFGRNISNV